jgi:hypothetical protein
MPPGELGAAVLEVEERRGEGGEGLDFFERNAERDEAEARAQPGEEGAFAGEEAVCGVPASRCWGAAGCGEWRGCVRARRIWGGGGVKAEM